MTEPTPTPKPRRKPGPKPIVNDVRAVQIGRCLAALIGDREDVHPAALLLLAIDHNVELATLAKLAKGIDEPTRKTAIRFYSTLGMEPKP